MTGDELVPRLLGIVEHFSTDGELIAKIRRAGADWEPAADRDPTEQLEQAVRAMHEHDGRTVAGWVLVVATQRIEPGGPGVLPVAYGAGYSIGAGTPPATALGLLEGAAVVMRKVVAEEVADEE